MFLNGKNCPSMAAQFICFEMFEYGEKLAKQFV